MALRGLFVTGTDTGAGKTVVAAAIAAALHARGERVAAFKPVVTGVGGGAGGPAAHAGGAEAGVAPWPDDHDLLAAVTGARPEDVAPVTFAPAVSPHLAAELAGTRLVLDDLVAAAHARAAGADVLVAEGVGGLLVPFGDEASVRDLAAALGLPVVVAARPGLGTINHTLLTLEAARAAGLDVRAVVLTPWPADPSAMERSNRETIARLGRVDVATLPPVRPEAAELARAGDALALDAWLAPR
ncbi:MAG TPA: dethiobiotin synthase [Solirubrobacteraceae bacterium]|nr:dethiobiotin synthase [Solirubrobacteraceae bacterium]